jgi:hypothetical protein
LTCQTDGALGLSVSKKEHLLKIGESRDLAFCKGKDSKDNNCSEIVDRYDIYKSEFSIKLG